MVALYVILAIIAFFIVLFSIRFTLYLTYDNEFKVDVKWLFIKRAILPKPKDSKKKEKKKSEKKKQEKEKKPEDDKSEEQSKEKPKKDVFLEEQETVLRERLGTAVNIQKGKRKGKIEIEFYTDDDLNRLIEYLNK